MAGFKTTSMRHVGMSGEDIKKAVLSRLIVGKKYKVNSKHYEEDTTECKLVEFSRNVVVFEHKNGTKESFTYGEVWSGMMEGTLL